ncbi:uncharacterized protein [Epargyreus clarus]|uniref:uncharacterized protein n=1 Tax=Epargyreus clarus TaxID=520877 RepID=UPI003C30D36F
MSCVDVQTQFNIITQEAVNTIIRNYGYHNKENANYYVQKASDKMLGFLADYWKLKVHLPSNNGTNKVLCFFIKAVSQNASKADMVREMKLFDKEINFYTIIKKKIELEGVKPWSPKLVSTLKEAIVFEDLNALGYNSRNKFKTFDEAHAKQALQMLARFHASSIIYEQKNKKTLKEEFAVYLDKGGYHDSNVWFLQCMQGALAAVKKFSKYIEVEQLISIIERRWKYIWNSALDLSNVLPESCSVVCHRDLWNNNILFHYKQTDGGLVPDDCVMVDFQAVRCQPPAGDVMLLLYCNLDPKFREHNEDNFLRFYYKQLELILADRSIKIDIILSLESFLKSAENQRLWALIVSACLVPQFWLDDDLTADIFCDAEQFNDILSNNKASFIIKMIESNTNYREKVMQIFEEIVDRYCLV